MPSGDRAVALATDLAVRHGGEIELCYALDRIAALADSCVGYDSNTTIEPFLESLDESATQFLRQALDRIRRAGVVATASILNGGPVASIVSAESSRPFDALVMGSQGKHGLQRFLMGSVADSVLRRSSIPVFVVKPSPNTPKVRFDRVLVAIDGSRARSAVVDFALDFAENENMKIVACNVAATGADVAMDLLETLCHAPEHGASYANPSRSPAIQEIRYWRPHWHATSTSSSSGRTAAAAYRAGSPEASQNASSSIATSRSSWFRANVFIRRAEVRSRRRRRQCRPANGAGCVRCTGNQIFRSYASKQRSSPGVRR